MAVGLSFYLLDILIFFDKVNRSAYELFLYGVMIDLRLCLVNFLLLFCVEIDLIVELGIFL